MIRGATRIAGVIGWPVTHSRSPEMFAAAFAAAGLDAAMIPIGVPPEDLVPAVAGLRAMRMLGASVTAPHKLAVAALCDRLSDAARAIGAVNCLQIDGAALVGHNTDSAGFGDGLREAGCTPGHAVLLGAGGAARAVAYGLRVAHASSVEVIARRPQQVGWITARPWTPLELRGSFLRADLVVDATPAGLAEGDAAMIDTLPLDVLRPSTWVSSLIYHRRTTLLERAAKRGLATVDGRGMLVHQGARAFAIWTSTAPPIHAMQRALDAAILGT